jgi:MoaA/NifB/PqqE/SkfB family radical SAM enzyme
METSLNKLVSLLLQIKKGERRMIKNAENIYEFDKMARVKPTAIELHLTNFCNHACSWCVADEVRQNKWHFSYEDAEKLITEFGEAEVGTIIYSGGGDPFMFKGLENLLELGHSMGMSNNLITNGFGLNEKNIPIVARTCEFVRISTDAGNKETHTLIHRPKNAKFDNFDVITKKIAMLTSEVKNNNHSTKVMLTFVVVDESIDSIPDFLKLAEELGVDSVDFKTNHFWSPEKKEEVYYTIQKFVENQSQGNVKINIEYPKSREGDTSEEPWNTFILQGIVEANGDMYPCCHQSLQKQWLLGNVIKTGFKDAWMGSTRREVLERVFNEKNVCPTCLDTDFNRKVNTFVSSHGLGILTTDNKLLSN